MYKVLEFPAVDETGNLFAEVVRPGPRLVKTASHGQFHPDIEHAIAALRSSPTKVYVLVNALGASEYYGQNLNNDLFQEHELNPAEPGADWGYKTFLNAGVFRNHKNGNRDESLGKVVCAVYNQGMHRVELIIEFDQALCAKFGHEDLFRKLQAGERLAVSMGCRVLWDTCTICGHKSKTRADYCADQKDQPGQILPDGRRVGVYNPHPKFFDISVVVIGADRTSFVMAKVARLQPRSDQALHGVDRAAALGLVDDNTRQVALLKQAARSKMADIVKQVPALAARTLPKLEAAEKPLPRHVLNMLGKHSLESALTSTTAAGIVLRPQEFQRIVLVSARRPDLADQLDNMGGIFTRNTGCDDSIQLGSPRHYAPELGRLLAPFLGDRSMFEQPLSRRVANISVNISMKCSDCGTPRRSLELKDDPLLEKIAAAYNSYRRQLLEKIATVATDITRHDVALLSAIGGVSFEDACWGATTTKSAAVSLTQMALVGAIPLAYLYGAYVGERGAAGTKLSETDSFIAQHPVLAASVFVGLTRLGMQMHQTGQLDKVVSAVGAKLSGHVA